MVRRQVIELAIKTLTTCPIITKTLATAHTILALVQLLSGRFSLLQLMLAYDAWVLIITIKYATWLLHAVTCKQVRWLSLPVCVSKQTKQIHLAIVRFRNKCISLIPRRVNSLFISSERNNDAICYASATWTRNWSLNCIGAHARIAAQIETMCRNVDRWHSVCWLITAVVVSHSYRCCAAVAHKYSCIIRILYFLAWHSRAQGGILPNVE